MAVDAGGRTQEGDSLALFAAPPWHWIQYREVWPTEL